LRCPSKCELENLHFLLPDQQWTTIYIYIYASKLPALPWTTRDNMDRLEAQSGFAPAIKSMKIEISILPVLGHIRQYVHCSVLPGWIIRLPWTTRDSMDRLEAQSGFAPAIKSMKI
jgi:hypothetical protein